MRAQRAADVRHRHAAVVEPAAADAAPAQRSTSSRSVVPNASSHGRWYSANGMPGWAARPSARAPGAAKLRRYITPRSANRSRSGRHARRHAAHVADRRLAARVGRLPAIERDEARERGHVGHFLVQPDLERRRHAGVHPGRRSLRGAAPAVAVRAADTARRAGERGGVGHREAAPQQRAARVEQRVDRRAASGTTRRTSPARSRVDARRHAASTAEHVVGVRGEEGEVGHHQASAGFFSRISKPSAPALRSGYRSTRLPRDRLRRRAHALRRA